MGTFAAADPIGASFRDAGGDTLLRGSLADQAALYGLLHRIRDLGLVLLAVARLPEDGHPEE